MKFTINVGLLNNPKTTEELVNYFQELNGYTLLKYAIDSGSYHELVEPTFVARIETDYVSVGKVIADFEKICSVLNQECIAIGSYQFEILVYAINYQGFKERFNEDYFLTV